MSRRRAPAANRRLRERAERRLEREIRLEADAAPEPSDPAAGAGANGLNGSSPVAGPAAGPAPSGPGAPGGSLPRGRGLAVAVGYPNRYALGMSNVGFQAVHRFFDLLPGAESERFFYPDRRELEEYRRTGLPLGTLESGRPVRGFDAVAFSITFEPDAVRLVEMLSLAGIPPLAADRGPGDPLVLAGGPVTFLNPEPLAPFVDAFGVGEAEALLPVLTERLAAGSREARLAGLAEEPGFYVPARHRIEYDAEGRLARRRVEGGHPVVRARMGKDRRFPPPATFLLTEDTEMSGKFLVEVSRGCPTLCRFCWAGYSYLPKRSFEVERLLGLARAARVHTDRIGLVSTAVGAHREIVPLVTALRDLGYRVSVSSVRFEDVRDEFVRPLAESGERTVAVAPEVGTDRLRRAIHKRVTNEAILERVEILLEAGVENLKLYLMVGLPGETDADAAAITPLVRAVRDRVRARRRGGRTICSVNPFIPKPGTPFQWRPMAPLPVLAARMRRLQRELGALDGVEAHCKSPRMERLQALLSVGDRRLAPVLLDLAAGRGLNESLRRAGLAADFYLRRERGLDEELPWSFLDTGMKDELLRDQLAKADRLVA